MASVSPPEFDARTAGIRQENRLQTFSDVSYSGSVRTQQEAKLLRVPLFENPWLFLRYGFLVTLFRFYFPRLIEV